MLRYVHRTGVGVVAWRQASGAAVAATCAPRDNHRRIVSRGRVVRVAQGYTAAGLASVSSDCTAAYAIITKIVADCVASYALRASVSADASASYNLLNAGIVTSDLASSYLIRAAVYADASAAYSIGANPSTDVMYPLAGMTQFYPLAGMAQT